MLLEAIVGLASLRGPQRDPEQAYEWLQLALHHPAAAQETRDRAGRLCAELEAQLASLQVEAARARAQAQSLEALVTAVLGTGPQAR
jgi:hypothetical protein